MSFKREGDDVNQLGVLRKRRINDLLAVDIPEDEALLMSSGRYACLVCHHRPVFDTLNMLSLHRGGKKHLASSQYKQAEQQELQELIQYRKHQQYLLNGSTDINQVTPEHRGLGLGVPYEPKSKKLKPNQRKQTLTYTAPETSHGSLRATTPKSCLKLDGPSINQLHAGTSQQPGTGSSFNMHKWNESQIKSNITSNQCFRDMLLQNGPLKHSKQLKKIFDKPESKVDEAKPYISKKDKIKMVTENTNMGHINSGNNTNQSIGINVNKSLTVPQSDVKQVKSMQGTQIYTDYKTARVKLKDRKKEKLPCQITSVSEEKKNKAEMYLHCRGAGWKKDLDGKWIKDENAEFDSDEEPPDLP